MQAEAAEPVSLPVSMARAVLAVAAQAAEAVLQQQERQTPAVVAVVEAKVLVAQQAVPAS